MGSLGKYFRQSLPALLLLLAAGLSLQAQVPPKPAVARAVNDFASVFAPDQAAKMEHRLVAFADSTSNQIVVVTVSDLGDYDSGTFAYEIGESWGVGSERFDNGIVVLVKPKTERSAGEVFIAIGYGLEGAIPDAVAKRIIEVEMIPHFRENDYFAGVDAALTTLMRLAAGEISYKDYAGDDWGSIVIVVIIVFGLIVLVVFIAEKAKGGGGGQGSGSSRSGGGHIFWTGTGGGRSGGGSFGGGFSGGFGGGSFGGGGARGSW